LFCFFFQKSPAPFHLVLGVVGKGIPSSPGKKKKSIAPGVGTRSNVKSPPGVRGLPGVGHEIDKCITIPKYSLSLKLVLYCNYYNRRDNIKISAARYHVLPLVQLERELIATYIALWDGVYSQSRDHLNCVRKMT